MRKREIIWIVFSIMTGITIGWYLIKNCSRKETVIMAGSVAMETFAEALAEKSKEMGVTLKPEFIGSSAGVEALLKDKAQIALVSRYLTEEEKAKGVTENIVAYDSIVIIVNKENTIWNLSKEQLSDIYMGKIKNWQELGGINEPIIVIGRECGSGTRDSFEKLLSLKEKTRYSNECDSIGVVKMKVELIRGAIGYVSLESVQEGVKESHNNSEEPKNIKIVAIDNIMPEIKAIEKGNYVLVRPFILATYGEWEKQSKEVRQIYHLLESKEGEVIFERAGVAAASKKRLP